MTVSTMIRLLRLRIALAALALSPLGLAGQIATASGSLPEDYLPGLKTILAEALNLGSSMLNQRIILAQAEAAKIQAIAGQYPRLTGNAGYGINGVSSASANSSSSSSSSGFNYGVGIAQPLFQEGDVKGRADIGKLGEQIAQKNYGETYRTLLGTLRWQYMQLVIKKASLGQARVQLRMQEKELEVKKDSIARGVSANDELPAAESVVLAVSLAADRLEQDYENSKRLFARLAGQVVIADTTIPDALPEPRLPEGTPAALLHAFLQGGVTETPTAQTYALYLRQSDISSRMAKYANYPKIGVSAGYNTGATTSSDSAGNVSSSFVASRSASIGMSFTLFDAGAARGGKLAAASTKRSFERQLQTYIETTRDEAGNRLKQVSLEYRAMQLSARNLSSAASALSVDQSYLASGQRSELDVERSKAAYQVGEIAAFNARAAFLQQWSEFVSLVGADPMMNQLPPSYLSHGK